MKYPSFATVELDHTEGVVRTSVCYTPDQLSIFFMYIFSFGFVFLVFVVLIPVSEFCFDPSSSCCSRISIPCAGQNTVHAKQDLYQMLDSGRRRQSAGLSSFSASSTRSTLDTSKFMQKRWRRSLSAFFKSLFWGILDFVVIGLFVAMPYYLLLQFVYL